MRWLFGVLSLLVVLAVIGMLTRTQLASLRPAAVRAASSAGGTDAAEGAAAGPRQMAQKIQADVERLMQQPPARGEPQE